MIRTTPALHLTRRDLLFGSAGAAATTLLAGCGTKARSTATTSNAPATPVSHAPFIVFAGNSLTVGVGSTEGKNYPNQTIALLKPILYDSVNVGVSGRTTATMITEAPKNVDAFYHPAHIKNIVVMWEGTNDLAQGADAERGYANIVTFCAIRKIVGWQVIVLTILPANTTRAGFMADRMIANRMIRTNWHTFADALADVAASPLIGNDGAQNDPRHFTADGIHMTNDGYAVIAGIVRDAILSL